VVVRVFYEAAEIEYVLYNPRPNLDTSEREMQSNVKVVLALFRAVEERDRETLFELCHDDVEFHDAASLPYGGTVRGKAEIRARLEAASETTWLGTWGPLQPTKAERSMDPRVIAAEGDQVAVLYTQRALSPGGERFTAPVVGLYEVRDGKFARAQMFHFDTAALLAFLDRAAASEPAPAASSDRRARHDARDRAGGTGDQLRGSGRSGPRGRSAVRAADGRLALGPSRRGVASRHSLHPSDHADGCPSSTDES
jgi:uncharacterized protein